MGLCGFNLKLTRWPLHEESTSPFLSSSTLFPGESGQGHHKLEGTRASRAGNVLLYSADVSRPIAWLYDYLISLCGPENP